MAAGKQQAFLDYLRQAAGGKAMPARADIDPVEMPAILLSDLFLVDVLAGGDFRYRLIGTHIVEHTGADYTGRRLSDLAGRGSQPELARLYAEVVRARKARSTRLPYKTPRMRAESRYEVLVAPLSADGATIDMLVGLADYPPAAAPEEED